MAFEMPRANKPENVGLSSQRLQRIRNTLQADIDKGLAPGAVLLIARRGQIASFEALGYRDREVGAVMTPDTTFRIASMRSEEHTSELQSLRHLVCRLL